MQILSLPVAAGYRVAAKALTTPCEQISFGVSAVIFVYAALDVVVLAKSVFGMRKQRPRADLDELERRVNELRRQKRKNSSLERDPS